MLILGDERVGGNETPLPWITWSLIAFNLLAFTLQHVLGDSLTAGCSLVSKEIVTGKDIIRPQHFTVKHEVYEYDDGGRVKVDRQGKPRKITVHEKVEVPHAAGPFPIYLTLLTSMFLHAGWMHLLGNMWFLAVFGNNVERTLGHGWFFGVYLLCGLTAGSAHIISDPDSIIPALGASGAISGVMAAYVVMFPLNSIKIWMGWWIGVVEVPAVIVIGIWGVLQYVNGVMELDGPAGGGVAYWAHLGGFLAGLLTMGTLVFLAHVLKPREIPVAEKRPESTPETPSMADLLIPPKPAADDLGGWKPQPATPPRITLSTAAFLVPKADNPPPHLQ
jgi:membrane associated rhomboid family serine protease